MSRTNKTQVRLKINLIEDNTLEKTINAIDVEKKDTSKKIAKKDLDQIHIEEEDDLEAEIEKIQDLTQMDLEKEELVEKEDTAKVPAEAEVEEEERTRKSKYDYFIYSGDKSRSRSRSRS